MKGKFTVSELIKYLQNQDPKAVVWFDYGGTLIPLSEDDIEFRSSKNRYLTRRRYV